MKSSSWSMGLDDTEIAVVTRPLIYAVVDSYGNTDWAAATEPGDTIFLCGLKDIDSTSLQFESEAYHLEDFCKRHGWSMSKKKHPVTLVLKKP